MTEQDWLLLYFALACMWIGGYATGRGRIVRSLVRWADWQVASAPQQSPRFWIALPIVLAAAGCLWVFRPRRTWTNYQAWKARPRPASPPRYNPDRSAHRGAHDTNGDT